MYSSLVSAGTYALAMQSWSKGIYLVALLKGSMVVAADKIMNR
jgi:hypothetical protein